MYYGPPGNSVRYFRSLGHPPPPLLSPTEFMLDLTNTDFDRRYSALSSGFRIETLIHGWEMSIDRKLLEDQIVTRESKDDTFATSVVKSGYARNLVMQSFILLQRMALVCPLVTCVDMEIIS